MPAAMLSAGFADPTLDSQRCFRAVLEAMSRPGRVQDLAGLRLDPPAPLGQAAAAVLLTLADADTPVWLDAAAAAAGAADWLRFHAGCPVVAEAAASAFALACGPAPALAGFRPGTEEAPQDSATLVLQVAALEEGAATGWRLAGPGIEAEHRLRVAGLPADFPAQWAANHARFPRGVDVILCAGARLAALPRSLRLSSSGA